MGKLENLKQKVKDNKFKIIAGVSIIGGAAYIIMKQNNTIRCLKGDIYNLKLENAEQQESIDILKEVMSGTVLSSLKASVKRQLRYAEGKLNNAMLNDSNMSEADKKLREEEVVFFGSVLEKIFKAEELLNNTEKRD